MYINKQTFCIHPNAAISTTPDGHYKTCCMSELAIRKEDGTPYKPSIDNMQEAFDSKWMNELRRDLNIGFKHPNCKRCWDEERAGQNSKRMRDSKEYLDGKKTIMPGEHIIKIVDLKMGNLCNLKCRICNPMNSSQWIDEWYDLRKPSESKVEFHRSFKEMRDAWKKDQNIWDNLEQALPNIEHMDLYGGEPLLIENMWTILKHSVEQGYSNKQTIHYNTNGSIMPNSEQIELWKQFKLVDVQVSVDDIGDRHHYQRYPSQWNKVREHVLQFKEHSWIRLSTNATISNYNIFYLDEITNEIVKNIGTSVWYNILHAPYDQSIAALDPGIKEILVKKLSPLQEYQPEILPILNFMSSSPDPDKMRMFVQRNEEQDEYRKQSFKDTFPEWWDILRSYYK
jgi:MoaA/NifB/PqqE/SkfB family radical SAM enzyme